MPAIPIPAFFPGSQAVPTGLPIFPDASAREEHGTTNVVTTVPIEMGPQLTDHVQPQPVPLVMDVVFTDHPYGIVGTSPRFPIPAFNRAKSLYEKLLGLNATRQPFEVWTSLRAYPSMIFTSILAPRSAESGSALVVSLVMQEVEIGIVDALQVLSDAALAVNLGAQDVGSLTPSADSAIDGVGAVA